MALELPSLSRALSAVWGLCSAQISRRKSALQLPAGAERDGREGCPQPAWGAPYLLSTLGRPAEGGALASAPAGGAGAAGPHRGPPVLPTARPPQPPPQKKCLRPGQEPFLPPRDVASAFSPSFLPHHADEDCMHAADNVQKVFYRPHSWSLGRGGNASKSQST